MRKTMILGAAIAALLISAIPAQAGCLSGLFGGMQARRAARQQAMAASAGACSSGYSSFASYSDAGSCYSAQYAASAACPTGNCPQTVSASYYSASAPCPTGNCPQTVSSYAPAPQRAIQYVYTQAPAPAITSTVQPGNCDANGDGKCDHCGMACNGAALPPAPATVTPPPTPPPLSRKTVKTKIVAFKPPDPIAPPIAYTPPAKPDLSGDVLVAFR